MQAISYSRHQFPPGIIRHAIWLYLRFTLSYRDVEEVLAERGLEISYETIPDLETLRRILRDEMGKSVAHHFAKTDTTILEVWM